MKYFLRYFNILSKLLIGAADTSGNDKCVSFVIGSPDSIRKIHEKLGFSNIHMRYLKPSEKVLVIKRMDIKGDVRIVCFHFSRHDIIKRIQAQLKGRIPKKGFLHNHFNDVFRSYINSMYSSYLVNHKQTLDSVIFECDEDMRQTFSHLGFQLNDPSLAHDLADVSAYCNYKGKKLNNVIEKHITTELEKELKVRCGI